MRFKVTNWSEYEAGLHRRGSLTLWVTAEALSSWRAPKRTTRGGQPRYSDLAIETALTPSLVFGLRLRQTEGLLASLLKLMGLDLAVPDHTTLSRRARTWRPADRRQGGNVPTKAAVHIPRHDISSDHHRELRATAMSLWAQIARHERCLRPVSSAGISAV